MTARRNINKTRKASVEGTSPTTVLNTAALEVEFGLIHRNNCFSVKSRFASVSVLSATCYRTRPQVADSGTDSIYRG